MNKTKKLIGGKKIGKGGFSCVVKPSIKCNRTKKNNKLYKNTISKISKLSAIKPNYNDVNNVLMKIDNEQKYFIYYIDRCILSNNQVKNRIYKDIKFSNLDLDNNNKYLLSDINDFEDLQCELNKKEKYINIVEKYGGESLYKIILFKSINIKPQINNIITHLLKGLQLLHKNNVVHRDIKIDNITIDVNINKLKDDKYNNEYIPKYIDFNNSYLNKDIKKVSVVGNYSYNISLDYLIYFYLYIYITKREYKFNNNLLKKISKLCTNTIKNSVKTLSNINISFTNLISIETNNIKVKSNKSNNLETVKFEHLIRIIYKIFKKQKNTLQYFKDVVVFNNDIYGLGIVFKILYTKYSLNNKKLSELIEKMTLLNPVKRINIDNAVDFWMKK